VTSVTSEARLRAMRWNERIRLVIGVFNRSAVAVLGAAAVGSAFRAPGTAAPAAELLGGIPLTSLVCALALHLLAHVLVGLIEPEE
jgi:hypothetical protein